MIITPLFEICVTSLVASFWDFQQMFCNFLLHKIKSFESIYYAIMKLLILIS